MTDTTYNGWANYETWNVNLWLGNDQGSYAYWQDQAAAIWEAATATEVLTRSESARYILADQLKSEIEESAPDLGASMFADLLNAALGEVRWDEIANGMLSDADGYESND